MNEPISRRIVARREIETSIDLFLNHRDPISAHVLAWASVEVMKGVAVSQDIMTASRQFEQWMGADLTNQWYKSAKKEYNFFKHSDRDPDAQLETFDPEETARVLMHACIDYLRIYHQMTWSMYMFSQWYLCRYPDLVKTEHREMMATISMALDNPNQCEFEASTLQTLAIIADGEARGSVVLKNCPDLLEP